jgi:hypothetical protein
MENLDHYDPEKYTDISNEDILYCRRKSVGIVEFSFTYGGRSNINLIKKTLNCLMLEGKVKNL